MIELTKEGLPVMWLDGLNGLKTVQAIEDLKWAQQVNKDIEADQRIQVALASLIAAETASATNTDDDEEDPPSNSDAEEAEANNLMKVIRTTDPPHA